MKVNIGFTDRIIRILLAALIVGLITNQMVLGTGVIILGIIVAIFILTSVVGVCPLYTLLGINTTAKT